MARPKKQPHEARSKITHTRMTDAEYVHVEQQARIAGVTVSDYIRQRTLKGTVTVPQGRADAAMLMEINRIGVNLNQIAHTLNRGGDVPHDLAVLQAKLYAVLEQVGRRYES